MTNAERKAPGTPEAKPGHPDRREYVGLSGEVWITLDGQQLAVGIFGNRAFAEEDARIYGDATWHVTGPYVLQRPEQAQPGRSRTEPEITTMSNDSTDRASIAKASEIGPLTGIGDRDAGESAPERASASIECGEGACAAGACDVHRTASARHAIPCTCPNPSLHERTCQYLLACAPYGRCAKCRNALTLPPSMPGVGPDTCGDCWRASQRTETARCECPVEGHMLGCEFDNGPLARLSRAQRSEAAMVDTSLTNEMVIAAALRLVFDEIGVACAAVEMECTNDPAHRWGARECLRRVAAIRSRVLTVSPDEAGTVSNLSDTEETIGPACPRGGEIVDYCIGLCSCGECPTPRPDFELPASDGRDQRESVEVPRSLERGGNERRPSQQGVTAGETAPSPVCGWCKGNPIGHCIICQAKPSTHESYCDEPELRRESAKACAHPLNRRQGMPDAIWCCDCGALWLDNRWRTPGPGPR